MTERYLGNHLLLIPSFYEDCEFLWQHVILVIKLQSSDSQPSSLSFIALLTVSTKLSHEDIMVVLILIFLDQIRNCILVFDGYA